MPAGIGLALGALGLVAARRRRKKAGGPELGARATRDAAEAAPPSRREARRAGRAGPQTPTTEERLEPVVEATQELKEAGEESVAGEREVVAENLEVARAEEAEQEAGQEAALEGFDVADKEAQAGLEGIQGEIQDTRDLVDALPKKIQTEFEDQRKTLDAGLEAARTGLESKSGEALSNVMTGRAGAMEAATASINGATRQQMSAIDAQVQQGTLSPSQATAMKAKIKMGASMQLSAAVGQTAHMFTQTQAQVATSFGQMFTSFESMAGQVTGQFGATAAGAFGQAQIALGEINVALTKTDAQAVASRDASLSTNATARSVAQNMNDDAGIAMMDYTRDTYISEYPMAVNNLTAMTDLAGALIRSDEMQHVLSLMEESAKTEQRRGRLGVVGALIQSFF